MGKQRSQPGGARALDYRFFDLQQKADGLFQIALAYQNDVVGQRLHEFAGQFARLLDGNALSQRVAFAGKVRSEEHKSELQSLMRISYAVFCLKKTTKTN